MQGVLGLLITGLLQICHGIFPWKKIESRFRFHRIMATSLWSHVFGPPCTMTRITATIVSSISLQLQHDALVSVSEMCTSHELKGYVVYVSLFYRFLDMAGYLSKVADFGPPQILLLLLPRREWPPSNFAEIFGIRKLASLGYRVVLFVWSYVWPF